MAAGEIVEWKEQGFGFIKPVDGGRDLFFHVQQWRGQQPPARGVRVEFELAHRPGKDRQEAVNVAPVTSAALGGEEFADVLSADEFWQEAAPLIRAAMVGVARAHGWVT